MNLCPAGNCEVVIHVPESVAVLLRKVLKRPLRSVDCLRRDNVRVTVYTSVKIFQGEVGLAVGNGGPLYRCPLPPRIRHA